MKPRIYTIAIVILVACAVVGQARVYWRWQGAARVDATLESLGATRLYQSEATVNQTAGLLSAYGFEENLEVVTARMGRELGLGDWYSGGQMSLTSLSEGSDTTRILALTVAPDRTIVVTFQADTKAMASASTAPTDPTLPHGLPMYPGSTLQFHASLEKSGCDWMTAAAPADTDTVQAHLNEALLADGWVATAATQKSGVVSELPCYERDGAMCWVWTIPSEEGLHSTTALLYRNAHE